MGPTFYHRIHNRGSGGVVPCMVQIEPGCKEGTDEGRSRSCESRMSLDGPHARVDQCVKSESLQGIVLGGCGSPESLLQKSAVRFPNYLMLVVCHAAFCLEAILASQPFRERPGSDS